MRFLTASGSRRAAPTVAAVTAFSTASPTSSTKTAVREADAATWASRPHPALRETSPLAFQRANPRAAR